MEFRILGPLEVRDGERQLPLGGAKQRALLAILLLHANEVLSRDRLIDELWGEVPPATAGEMVRIYVSRLRKALDSGRRSDGSSQTLRTRPSGYQVQVGPDELDRARFERLLREGRSALVDGDPTGAAESLDEGLALWRGPALQDFTYEPFAQAEIARLEELRLTAVEERAEAWLALGRHGELVAELEALVTQNRLRERLRGQLMLALYRSGRQSEALDLYREWRRVLVEELGMEPGPALQHLERAILRQDPSLDPAARQPTRTGEPRALQRWTRKTVTVVSTEIGGLPQPIDPEGLRGVAARYRDIASPVFARHGAHVEAADGGSVLAVYGIPRVHEDDAVRAVRAAVELRGAAAGLIEELRLAFGDEAGVCVGIDTGEVVATEPGSETASVAGDSLGRAVALQQEASPGEILLGEATRRAVSSAALVEAIGPSPNRKRGVAWRLLELVPETQPLLRRLDGPIVGRQAELARLRSALDHARHERRLHCLTVLGPAGIGKSRLAGELVSSLADEATVLVGRCLPYGEGITFWPIREIVREASGEETRGAILDLVRGVEDAERIADGVAAALGLTEAGPGGEAPWAIRRLLEALARGRALVVVFEDLHWAEPGLLDLLDYLTDSSRDAPILLLCLARPELLEQRPSWGTGRSNAASLTLEPLIHEETEALLDNLLGGATLDPQTRARIGATAEGNPLFVEQLLATVAEHGGGEDEPSLPATIQALLAARLDRLGPGERAVIERAAVVGRDFREDVVLSLLPPAVSPFAPRHLQALVRKDFVHPDGPEGFFRFRHVLIQEAAYRGTSKELRTELHERFAAAIAQEGADEVVGYHLEQSFRYREQLGWVDERAASLATEAAGRLARAGRRAFALGDTPAAINLLSRAQALLPPMDHDRLELLPQLARALMDACEFARAETLLADAIEGAAASRDRGLLAHALVQRYLPLGREPGSSEQAREVAMEAIEVFTDLGDERGLTRAWKLVAMVHHLQGQFAREVEALERVIAHARRIGNEAIEGDARSLIAYALAYGPAPAEEVIRYAEDLIGWAQARGNRVWEADALTALALGRAFQGRFSEARDRVARAWDIIQDVGRPWSILQAAAAAGHVELLAGDPLAAERQYRSGEEPWRGGDEADRQAGRVLMAGFFAMLGQALFAQGRYDEAERFATATGDAAEDDIIGELTRRGVLAKVLARRGSTTEAESLAREASDLAQATDSLHWRACALMDLAEVLRLVGKSPAAMPALEEALRLCEQKGNLATAARIHQMLAEPPGNQSGPPGDPPRSRPSRRRARIPPQRGAQRGAPRRGASGHRGRPPVARTLPGGRRASHEYGVPHCRGVARRQPCPHVRHDRSRSPR